MADSLLPKDRKKQLMQEITLEPAGGGEEKADLKTRLSEAAENYQQRLSFTAKAAEQTRR